MSTSGSILAAISVAIILLAGGGLFIAYLEERRKRKQAERTLAANRPLPRYAEPASDSAPAQSQPEPLPVPQPDNTQERIKDRLRERKAASTETASSLALVTTEFGDDATMDEILRVALQIGYPPAEVATFMAGREYQLEEIAILLIRETDLEVEALTDAIAPLAEGETLAAKAELVFKAVKGALDDNDEADDQEEALLKLPARLGCSPEEAAAIVYRNTGLNLGSVLGKLKLCSSPDVAARIAENLDVDLSDEDEYKTLCEDGEIEFAAAAAILKACGKDAETVITAGNSDDEFSDVELDVIFSALGTAGFTNAEIMAGISEAEIVGDNALAVIIQSALEQKVPMEEIVSFLKKEDANSDDLDEEMRQSELEILTRVDVLHALLHVDDNKSAAEEVVESKPE
jgi:cell division septation protein DedD